MRNIFIYLVLVSLLAGCSGKETEEAVVVEDSTEVNQHSTEQAKKIFFLLPSPIEISTMLFKAGANYDGKLLNPVENVSRYETAYKKAINLGVYASDLSLASIFDQTQEAMFYVANCKKLADGLGISEAFGPDMMERMEANINDRDSMMRAITDAYWMADSYLKENERSNVSSLVIAGGWVEGVYLATSLAKITKPNEALIERVLDQKHSLEQLIGLLDTYTGDDEIDGIKADLISIQEIYKKADAGVVESTVTSNSGVATLNGGEKLTMSKEVLDELTAKVIEIRTKITQ